MTPEQAAHYKMLAEAHTNTPGHEAELYRVIGELLKENEALQLFYYHMEDSQYIVKELRNLDALCNASDVWLSRRNDFRQLLERINAS